MVVKVIGSHMCPSTLYAINKLAEADIGIKFVDMFSSHEAMHEYLWLREHDPLYDDVRGSKEKFGIPCFILEDGTKTRDLDAVLKLNTQD